ncbi:hypothetical protein G5V57_09550 [Nordella sp. HKS 07]|uniref:hypothetical protein n=1 Tax=Nordella sp. HKS 07 TaxID=2712222 RepID=UPI0013E0F21D|nr:hypothetical protein [Nordella sp. HKS 07]QIG47939.1 hypothetical protein G5V57_09550 [Nordella sp. HKS 07]
MFGFLIRSEVNDDAVRLKTLVDQAVSRYLSLSREELKTTIPQAFPESLHHIDHSGVNFIFPEFKEFLFMLKTGYDAHMSLSVLGRGKYAGFILSVGDKNWNCSVSDGIAYRATGGAKKLAQLMEKKFNVFDATRFM